MNDAKVKNIAFCGMMLCLCLIFSYVESMFNLFPSIPGIKLGLSNALILVILYVSGIKEALSVQISRLIICALLFGTPVSFVYSFSAGLVSLLIMSLIKKTKITGDKASGIILNGICSGMTHNVIQLVTAYVFVKNAAIFYYLPVLLVAGALCGLLTGSVASRLGNDRLRSVLGK